MTVRHLFVIDSRLPDAQTLRAALPPDSDWTIVDAQADGVAQLESITARYAGLESIHLLAHGRPGALLLGSGWLTADTVRDQSPALARIGASLAADGDILVYGCETGTGTVGQRLIEALAQASGAEVAASVDSTGAQSLGGNWALERRAGEVSTAALDPLAYPALLGTTTFPGLQHEYAIGDTVSRSGILISGPGLSETLLDADTFPRALLQPREESARSDTGIAAHSLLFADATVNLVVAHEVWVSSADLSRAPSVAALVGGGWIVSWAPYDSRDYYSYSPVFAQRYGTSGAAVGEEFRVNTSRFGLGSDPSVAALANGGWIAAWQSRDSRFFSHDIDARRYGLDGIALSADFPINKDVLDDQLAPSVAALADGGWIVVWHTLSISYGIPAESDIYAKRYRADGAAVGTVFQVNRSFYDVYPSAPSSAASVAALSDGGWIVGWQSQGQDGSGFGVYAQRYGADGAVGGARFRVNTHVDEDQFNLSVAALGDGGWIVAWQSQGQDGSGAGIYAQRYGADSAAAGAEFRVNSETHGDQENPSVAALSDGGWIVAWQSQGQDGFGSGIYSQRYRADGAAGGAEFRVNGYTNGDQEQPSVVALADGGWVISWFLSLVVPVRQPSDVQPGWYSGIYQQRYGADGQPVETVTRSITGDATAQSLLGGASDDFIDAGGGDDTLDGGAGGDLLFGGIGNDTYLVENTQDVIRELSGEGTDLIVSTVTTYLSSHVENLTLSGTGPLAGDGNDLDNTITGNSGNNTLEGASGDDTLIGGRGDDLLTGGNGHDTLIGGEGLDVALYSRRLAPSDIVRLPNGDIQIRHSYQSYLFGGDVAPDEVAFDTLHEVERAVFLGVFPSGAVGFDTDGTGGQAYRLYQTAFDRMPDQAGVGFWIDRIDRGFGLVNEAEALMSSAEFKRLYGESPSNEQFINLLYANVMNRAPDPGYYFWLDALYGRGQFEGTVFSRPFVLAQFSESPENQANVIGAITNGFFYEPFTPQ
jgi:Ca2+-binding RTX toxin-like protein